MRTLVVHYICTVFKSHAAVISESGQDTTSDLYRILISDSIPNQDGETLYNLYKSDLILLCLS